MSLWQLAGDHDWCLPASMASGAQTNLSSTDGGVASRERVVGSAGVLRPSRGAEDVYAQARTLFRAMVQVPHYSEEVRKALRVFEALTKTCIYIYVEVINYLYQVARHAPYIFPCSNHAIDWRDTSHKLGGLLLVGPEQVPGYYHQQVREYEVFSFVLNKTLRKVRRVTESWLHV